MRPLVTYFILNWNPFDSDIVLNQFTQTIENLYKNSDPNIDKEVYVITQDYTDKVVDDVEKIRKEYGFKTIYLDHNIGISAGINLGFNISRGDVMALLTYDVAMPVGCDSSCIKLLQSDPDIYQVMPSDDASDCPLQRQNKSKKTSSVISAELTLCYYSRETVKTVGYYDERWKACYENMDYNLRTVLSGKKIIINHETCLHHIQHNTSNIFIGIAHAYDKYIPWEDVGKMWHEKWGTDIPSELNIEGENLLDEHKIKELYSKYKNNIYLEFLQDRKY